MRRLLLASVLLLGACAEEPSSHLPVPKAAPLAAFDFTPPEGFTRLRIGLVPYSNPEELKAAHRPLADWLSTQLKVPVELVMGDNYDDAALKLERGEVDLVEFSPYAYVRAEKRLKLRPLVTAIADGSETAAGYILVRHDSPRRSLEDLKGGTFGFVDPASASGYLFPMKVLKDRGLDTKTLFTRTEFFGNHEKVLLAVYEGKVDAGATYQGTLAALKRSRGIDPLNFRIIAKTPRSPRDLFCVRAEFPAELGDALLKIFLSLSARDPKGRDILAPLNMNGFFPANDRLYDGVRAAAAAVAPNEAN
jgi:phosphonate transport system substrate-binding protein